MSQIIKFGPWGFITAGLFLLSIYILLSGSARHTLRQIFAPADRHILSVANGRVTDDKTDSRIIKVLTPEGIFLEIYTLGAEGGETFFDRFKLPDNRDGYFQFRGHATNLALKDMNNDRVFEIIAPTYDAALVPHLNIYRFNKDSKKFESYIE